MKLTYWVADYLIDSACYSIRAKTRREVIAEVAAAYRPESYSKPRKVVVEYRDAFDLLEQCCSGEDRIAADDRRYW